MYTTRVTFNSPCTIFFTKEGYDRWTEYRLTGRWAVEVLSDPFILCATRHVPSLPRAGTADDQFVGVFAMNYCTVGQLGIGTSDHYTTEPTEQRRAANPRSLAQ